MKKSALTLAVLLSSMFASAANADCRTDLFSGLNPYSGSKEYQLTIHKNNSQWVSHSSGTVYKPNGWTNLYGGIVRQLFSDRTFWTAEGSLQRFSALQANTDYMEVSSITPQGVITIVNSTWNFTWSINTVCQGNLLTGFNNDVAVIFSAGPLN